MFGKVLTSKSVGTGPSSYEKKRVYRAAVSQRLRNTGLRRRYAAAVLVRLRVRTPPETLMFVSCECCVLSGRGLCEELPRPEESCRLGCVVVCCSRTIETSRMRIPWPTARCHATNKRKSSFSFTFSIKTTNENNSCREMK